MRTRPLGTTGLQVSQIGLGAGPLGSEHLSDAAAVELIVGAIECGVSMIDTAPSYGRSEERIGVALRGRRDGVVVSTKLGYGVDGTTDWTAACVTGGVDRALRRLATDRIDIAHLHSCPLDVLTRGEVVDALERAVKAGKVRVAAYSGDNDALAWAVDSGRFGVIQCSVSALDQRALDRTIPQAAARGLGVLAKRPLANGVWREAERPEAADRAMYWERMRAMDVPIDAASALGFVLAQPQISAALVGTTSLAHLRSSIEIAERFDGAEVAAKLRAAFRRCDQGWDGII